VHENRLLTLRLRSGFPGAGSLYDTVTSAVPNVGITPEFTPERK
jgi:hypothetical protein